MRASDDERLKFLPLFLRQRIRRQAESEVFEVFLNAPRLAKKSPGATRLAAQINAACRRELRRGALLSNCRRKRLPIEMFHVRSRGRESHRASMGGERSAVLAIVAGVVAGE